MKKKITHLIYQIKRSLKIIYHLGFAYWLGNHYGSSMSYLGKAYTREPSVPLHINDRVIIHPVPGISQATKSYPAVVRPHYVQGKDGRAAGHIWVLTVEGIEENKDWKGAWLNEYAFNRLEFVSRNYKAEQ